MKKDYHIWPARRIKDGTVQWLCSVTELYWPEGTSVVARAPGEDAPERAEPAGEIRTGGVVARLLYAVPVP